MFQQCTDTIVRQVDDIKRMVDEFSRFARMPKPVDRAPEDVADTVRQVVFLMRVGNADIDIDVDIAEDPMPAQFDRRLISQGLTNIIKNATEAISAVPPAEELGRGHIDVRALAVTRDGGVIFIDVVDNGIGLPKENRSRLLGALRYHDSRARGPASASRSSAKSWKSMAAAYRAARMRRTRIPRPARRLGQAALRR